MASSDLERAAAVSGLLDRVLTEPAVLSDLADYPESDLKAGLGDWLATHGYAELEPEPEEGYPGERAVRRFGELMGIAEDHLDRFVRALPDVARDELARVDVQVRLALALVLYALQHHVHASALLFQVVGVVIVKAGKKAR